MKTDIVLGVGYGDEGKGNLVGALALQLKNPIVVRFGGGHQVGHTVMHKEKRHVFSSYGSGTMFQAPTYISNHCTFDPVGMKKEYEELEKKEIEPFIIIDPLAMCTTPEDKASNDFNEANDPNGSCGVGFGETVLRNENHFNLFAQDLLNKHVFEEKYKQVMEYHNPFTLEADAIEFKLAVGWFLDQHFIQIGVPELFAYNHVIFEGHQGIMLDQHHGFFPHVTRANTTCRNAVSLIKRFGLPVPTIYYVSRAYQTRHGFGPMSNEDKPVRLKNNKDENNKDNEWQGDFRTGMLDINLVNHAIEVNRSYKMRGFERLVVNCIDQIKGSWQCTLDGNVFEASKNTLEKMFDIPVFFNGSPYSEDLHNELRYD